MDIMGFPAYMIKHPGGIFYVFVMNTEQLLKIAYVSTDEKDLGVQRPLSEKRCKDVAKYINSDNGIIANNIILNLPDDAIFIVSDETTGAGLLEIPIRSKSAWVIDGQHRLFGFSYAKRHFNLLCSAFIGLDVQQQADLFITINTNQKGIPASVIYDMLPIVKDAEFKKKRAHSLIKQFNEDSESSWYNDIKMLGVGKGRVSQGTFAKNIEKIIDPNGGVLSFYNESVQYSILKNYFCAFRAVFPKAWASNKYILTKSLGLAAMCGIFPKVYELCNKNYKVENIIEILDSIKDFDFSSATLGKGTNNVAIQNTINDLLLRLPNLSIIDDIQY